MEHILAAPVYPGLEPELEQELADTLDGPVYNRGHAHFAEQTRSRNGYLICKSKAVVCPFHAEDVSRTILFCRKHDFSLSVKAGGYAVAGWSIAGDVVMDMCLLDFIDIESPRFTSLPRALKTSTTSNPRPSTSTRNGSDHPIDSNIPARPIMRHSPDAGHPSETKPVSSRTTVQRDWTSLREMPASRTSPSSVKGKGRAGVVQPPARGRLKRARSPDENGSVDADDPATASAAAIKRRKAESSTLGDMSYDDASAEVAAFLHGPALPPGSMRADEDYVNLAKQIPPSAMKNAPIDAATLDSLPPDVRHRAEAAFAMLPLHEAPHSVPAPTDFTQERLHSPERARDPFAYLTEDAGDANHPVPAMPPPSEPAVQEADVPARPGMQPRTSTTTLLAADVRLFGIDETPRLPELPPVPTHPHAYVTFGAGMQQRDVDMFTASHPLPATTLTGDATTVPYHVPFAAYPVGSSTMILGGFGFQSRMRGLSVDNLVEAEIVLADGRVLMISEDENSDLWWAFRGGGAGLGIVTRYKARAYPVPVVFAGNLIFRFHRATAPGLIRHYRDCIKGVPREMYANVLLTTGPAGQDGLVVLQMCYLGSREKGDEFMQALSSWDGEQCLLNEVQEKAFLAQQDSIAQIVRGQNGNKWYIRSTLINSLTDEVINATVLQFAEAPSGCTWMFELTGGALEDDCDKSCISRTQREAQYNCVAFHQSQAHIDDPRCRDAAEKWIEQTLHEVSSGAPFTTFLGRHEKPERVIACFGENWDRLRALKLEYDPDHFFRHSYWPLTADGDVVPSKLREPLSP